MSAGTVYGVGVGPGDPELLTLKAARLLGQVPVIAYPAPEQGESLARRIAAPHIADGKTEIAIRMPLVESRFPAAEVYDSAASDIAMHAHDGRDVAVLCEGDPFLFGSFRYLFARLADRCPVEIVPGVTSLVACAAVAAMPLAARNDVLTVIPAPLDDAAIADRLAGCDAAVIVKIGRHLGRVRALIDRLGLGDGAHLVERATMTEQRVRPLAAVTEDTAPYFSTLLIHKRGAAWRM